MCVERGTSKRTTAVGDDEDKGLLPSSCGPWLPPRPEPAYVPSRGLPTGVAVLPVAVAARESNGESLPVVEEGETGSTMARADADVMSALEDVSGRGIDVRTAAKDDWDNKDEPVAVCGRSSSLQSSKTERRLD